MSLHRSHEQALHGIVFRISEHQQPRRTQQRPQKTKPQRDILVCKHLCPFQRHSHEIQHRNQCEHLRPNQFHHIHFSFSSCYAFHLPPSFAQVSFPIIPSVFRPFAFWKRITASRVPSPNAPSAPLFPQE